MELPKYIYVASLLAEAAERAGYTSQRRIVTLINKKAVEDKLGSYATTSEAAWSGYLNGKTLPEPDLLRAFSELDRVKIPYSKFLDARNQDRVRVREYEIKQAEMERRQGELYNALTTAQSVIRELESFDELPGKARILVKAYIIFVLIGTHVAGRYQIDQFIGDKLAAISRLANSLKVDNMMDIYFDDYAKLLPFLVEYVKGHYRAARPGVLKLLVELRDPRVKSLALRDLLVSTARCVIDGTVPFSEWKAVQNLVENYLMVFDDVPAYEARLFEGLARSKLILSRLSETGLEWEDAVRDIEEANNIYFSSLTTGLDTHASVNIQIARTEMEIYINTNPLQEEQIKKLMTKFAQAMQPGFDRYWSEFQSLAARTKSKDITKLASVLFDANRTPGHG